MRWLHAAVAVLSIMTLTGCPSEFGKDGRISKAVHKDSKERLLEIKRCSEEWKKEVCSNGPNRDDEKCQECGGR